MKHSRIFASSFLCGIALFITLNIYSYIQANPPCCDFAASFGFPFELGNYGGFVGGLHIRWGGVIANMFTALAMSYILGWVVDKVFMSRNRLP
jgi:hypothetical protein